MAGLELLWTVIVISVAVAFTVAGFIAMKHDEKKNLQD